VPLAPAVPAAVMPLCDESASGTGRACSTKEQGHAHQRQWPVPYVPGKERQKRRYHFMPEKERQEQQYRIVQDKGEKELDPHSYKTHQDSLKNEIRCLVNAKTRENGPVTPT